MILLHVFQNILSAPDDRNAFDIAPPFVRVVVNDAHDALFCFLRGDHIPDQHLSRGSRADHHHPAHRFVTVMMPHPLIEQKPIRNAHTDQQQKLEDHAPEIIGQRHFPAELCNGDRVYNRSER